jgi:hypothetical protein
MISLSRPFLFSAILLSHTLAARAADTFLWDQVSSQVDASSNPLHLLEQLTPSQDLDWVQCYSTFQCTRLEARFISLRHDIKFLNNLSRSLSTTPTQMSAPRPSPSSVSQPMSQRLNTEAHYYSTLADPEGAASTPWSRTARAFKQFLEANRTNMISLALIHVVSSLNILSILCPS